MDAGRLLNQFLGGAGGGGNDMLGAAQRGAGAIDTKSAIGGLAAGGLLGALLSGKKTRKMAGGVARYGAAAALGALAFKAYQNYRSGQAPEAAPAATPAELETPAPKAFQPEATPAADGQPFQLVLIQAMIGAAKADGHVDSEEQARLFEQVEAMGLDAEGKAFVFDALREDADMAALASAARTEEQAAEIYLVSRLAIDPDHPAERAYLEALAHRMNLPADLVAHLDKQVDAAG